MIVGRDTKPERQIYNLGAQLLGVLGDTSGTTVELYPTYENLNARQGVSVNAFLLALDWLFLIGAVSNDDGRIKKCF